MAEELEQVETKTEVDADILHEAKSQGWLEMYHSRGNPNDWVDAERFVQREPFRSNPDGH
jgi:hypothetical protein